MSTSKSDLFNKNNTTQIRFEWAKGCIFSLKYPLKIRYCLFTGGGVWDAAEMGRECCGWIDCDCICCCCGGGIGGPVIKAGRGPVSGGGWYASDCEVVGADGGMFVDGRMAGCCCCCCGSDCIGGVGAKLLAAEKAVDWTGGGIPIDDGGAIDGNPPHINDAAEETSNGWA